MNLVSTHLGGTQTLWNKGGEAPALPGAAGTVSSETEACGDSGRWRSHYEKQREIQHSGRESTRDGIQGTAAKLSFTITFLFYYYWCWDTAGQ